MDVSPTTFRLAALLLGLAGVISTALVWGMFWVSIASGVLFGAGGWLIDCFTGFRRLGGIFPLGRLLQAARSSGSSETAVVEQKSKTA